MKHYLFLGATSVVLLSWGQQVYAGSYGQDNARLMNDMRYMESKVTAPVYHTTQVQMETEEAQVSHIQPASGHKSTPYDDFTGIYGGGDVGYSFSDDVKGWNGSLFIGYGFEHEFDVLGAYAGFELGHEWSEADGSTNGLSFQKDHAWTATLRPGVSIMDDGLGYGIIGYSRAEFASGGDEEYLDGMILGLGGQFNTGMAFKPRLEYTYANYEDASIGGTEFAATENAVKLGAVFQF